jgi:arylsulfatase A-like enzyme
MRVRACLLAGLCLLATLGAATRAEAQQARPNVVVLMTDDQTAESVRVMPNVLRLLGDQGVTFDRSFVEFALCCPSRATLFTGQYSHNHHVRGLSPPFGGYIKLDTSSWLPLWLKDAGYTTIHLGKFLNGYGTQNPNPAEIPSDFDDWQGSVDPSTYQYYGYTLNENGVLTTYGEDRDPALYQTDFYGRRASELIERHAISPSPFFLSVAFLGPHHGGPSESDDPRNLKTPAVAPRHRNALARAPLPLDPSFNEIDTSDKPRGIYNRVSITLERTAAIREAYHQRLESLLAVDDAVGQIVEALQRTGELNRTLIVFTSDNGFLHGEHRVPFGKVLPYEPSIRVPLIIRGPGVPRGQQRSQLVTNTDLSPTILDAAGARAGITQDGRSLFPVMRDSGLEWGRDLLIFGRGTRVRYNAIRTPRFIYTAYAGGGRELYDLQTDPYQLNSVHADPAYDAVRRELTRRLKRLRNCRGASCSTRPELELRVEPSSGCVAAPLRARIEGRDLRLVRGVSYLVDGRRVARSAGAGRLLRTRGVTPGARFKLRVRVRLMDGRIVTLDRRRRACA